MFNKNEYKKTLYEKGLTQNGLARLMSVTNSTMSYKVKNQSFSYQDLQFLHNLFGHESFIKIFFGEK